VQEKQMRKVYIVEDDESIREIVTYALSSAGYEAKGFENGEEFFEEIHKNLKELPDMVILDIMMPGDNGLTILKRLRNTNQTNKIPVIMLTAKGTEIDKVKGLDMGADDYITKPFGVMELISRVSAVLRRTIPVTEFEETLEYENLEINTDRRTVKVDNKEQKLTYKEYELLLCLIKNKGKVLTRDKILINVWDTDFEGESRTLDMHIHSLRQKLGTAGKHIKTVRNVGYKFGD